MREVVVRILLFIGVVQCVPPSPTSIMTDELKAEFSTVKNTIKLLSDQWEKWNTLFITSLEPRITSTASTLASIDSNIHNLQERAHVWDTFQLHVSAWNEQLSSLDRKIDIISKGQEKVMTLDNKINTLLAMEYKLDNTIKTLNNLQDAVGNLDDLIETKNSKTSRDSLLNEFTTRGVLSSIKMVEKKMDRLLLLNQNNLLRTKPNERPKWQIKCNTPKLLEELLNDISSKVDVIFDNLSADTKHSLEDSEYDGDYVDIGEGSGDNYRNLPERRHLKTVVRRGMLPCKQINQALDEILSRVVRIENTSLVIVDAENTNFEKLSRQKLDSKIIEFIRVKSSDFTKNINIILDSYFSEQRVHFENILNKMQRRIWDPKPIFPLTTTTPLPTSNVFEDVTLDNTQATWRPILDQTKASCEDLSNESTTGVYIFNSKPEDGSEMFSHKRFCDIRDDGLWTVVQRRDNYSTQHNFNVSWEDYRQGFGDLHRDFWMGNEFLHQMSQKRELLLRIELEDFDNNSVWAEYNTFRVGSERDKYQLIVDDYTGNASDSFSSHNGSYFSTYDKTNDEAPECCPCAVSYGGGWWFNKCFESNLNGIYHKKSNSNSYFRGLIWENWLGNYSLKMSTMMVKSKGQIYTSSPTVRNEEEEPERRTLPYYEDP